MAVNADGNGDRLRFAGIEFDLRTGEIWKDGSRTVLPEQLFRVLTMLVREHFSLRDGAFCVWLQPVDPTTMRPVGVPRAVQHLHEPRLRASVAATASNDVHGGYLYVTLTETIGNIWMLHGGPTPLTAAR